MKIANVTLLKAYKRRHGLSVNALADELEVNSRTVRRWLKGTQKIPLGVIQYIEENP